METSKAQRAESREQKAKGREQKAEFEKGAPSRDQGLSVCSMLSGF
jgi:hypothetical protein